MRIRLLAVAAAFSAIFVVTPVPAYAGHGCDEKNYAKHSPEYLVDAVRALDKNIERRVRFIRRDKKHKVPSRLAS